MPSGCAYPHPFTFTVYCILQYALYWYKGKCIHIDVGFDVARSTIQGNAKASISGTSDKEIPRLLFNLVANLG